jgi:glutathione S-transferase
MTEPPVLYHLKVSNYNEKARWALDFKRVPHVRRAAIPGRHRKIAGRLTGGTTFPVLVENGTALGDSSRIIAHLETRYPAPALYPEDPDERRRALELERFFDEQLGPSARLLLIHHILPDARLFIDTFVPDAKPVRRALAIAWFPRLRAQITRSFGIDRDSVARAFDKLRLAGAGFRDELGPSGYLAGDRFTVADLTVASLVAPVVAPERFPYPQPQRDHPRLKPVRDALAEYGLPDWTRHMYAKERPASAALRE